MNPGQRVRYKHDSRRYRVVGAGGPGIVLIASSTILVQRSKASVFAVPVEQLEVVDE